MIRSVPKRRTTINNNNSNAEVVVLVPNEHQFALFDTYHPNRFGFPFSFSLLLTDNIEFDAQVPAAVPFGAGQRYPQATIFNVQDVCVQGDRIYCGDRLSK